MVARQVEVLPEITPTVGKAAIMEQHGQPLQEKTLLVGPCMKTSDFLLPVLSDWYKDVKDEVKEFDKAEDGEFDKDTVQ